MDKHPAKRRSFWEKFPKTFYSLRFTNYRNFWFNEFFSLIGMWMQIIAHGWLVYNLTGSIFLLGVINTISGLPILFLSPFGGLVADNFDKRKILILTQTIFTILAFFVGYLIFVNKIDFIILLITGFLMGIANALDSPTRQAFVVELVGPSALDNAIALNSLAFNTARMIGPAIAGYVIAGFGIGFCYFANAVTFFGVIIALILMNGDFSPKIKTGIKDTLLELKKGAQYIYQNKNVYSFLVLLSFTSIFVMPYTVLMPVFAKDVFRGGPQALGTLMASSGFGALLGAFMLANLSGKLKLKRYIFLSTFLLAISLAVFSISHNFYLSMIALMIVGWGVVSQAASINTFIQKEVPHHLRGRIMSYYVISFMGLMPVGAFVSGILAQYFGAPLTLFLGALIVWVALIFVFLRK